MKLFALILLSINCALVVQAATTKSTPKDTPKPTPKATTTPTVPTTKPSTQHPTAPTAGPTSPPLDKNALITKGTDLQKKSAEMIDRLNKSNRGSLTAELKRLSDSVTQLVKDLTATDAKTGPTLLKYIETELFWFEERLRIEAQVVAAAEIMLNQLLDMANRLSSKIGVALKNLEGTPMGDVMKQEGDSLTTLISDLVSAKNANAIEAAGKELAKMTDRVDKELKAFNIPPL